ncbi:MAG: acyl-CoA dehydrogenase family protein [Donghicola eburneus]|jgi:alkylation response protein AidB-like acyl-CoA dehydrogenase|uniref:acyl-CoA dehydrogenase family protein n=1 Tax=Actibacterium ureilyticum TaxID=1590614 RepID=UPI000BAADDCF|nr:MULTISPECIES: acyl-CoA dehydrogenase family protein [Roseobacteraceae]MAX51698.1 pimeloyl-CoA dehydrogenase large subunit [Methylophaga sp.]MCI5042984.1 acyl-CoA dehydrogenase family protein [Donghicola eburneus]
MDLNYTDEQKAFRDEVRSYLAEKLPARLVEKVRLGKTLTKQDHEEWHAILNERGWLAGNWPKTFGGAGWDAVQRHIFEDEMTRAAAPRIVPFGLGMLGPVLQKFGSKAQQDHYLPRILSGDDWWCQGYSEPGAGSDLASVRTTAERDGDDYIVNGQKTWTTLGQHANMIFCLVRTSKEGKPQEGISFLLIDMNSPGVKVRPIVLIDGEPEVNEVFFDDVRVPVENRVGEENKGWTYAKYLLTHERTNIAGVGFANAGLENLKRIARLERANGRPLIENPHFAARIARVEIDLMAMSTTNLRVVSKAAAGQAPGAESSMLKIKGTVIRQEINALTRSAVGPYAMPFASEALEDGSNLGPVGPDYAETATAQYLNNRKLSIFGGSNEIQRAIISKAILEL